MLLVEFILQRGVLKSLYGKHLNEGLRFGDAQGNRLGRFVIYAAGQGTQLLVGPVQVFEKLHGFSGDTARPFTGDEVLQEDEEVDGDGLGVEGGYFESDLFHFIGL